MGVQEEIGKDLVESVLNQVLRIYSGPLNDENHPLRQNETLGPLLRKLDGADTQVLLELIEHSSVMVMHALLNHLTNFCSPDVGYSFEIMVVQEGGNATSLLDYFDDPGMELVAEGGWVDQFCKPT
ncbi:hypothetical protein [Ruegeria sp. HKCCD8929]|uniref:hypothetical protein n=1 Tax=Ruegeria sp. HKCCD8929 TaxID=2683006 RepID=UPI001489882E|nr:hypothetical protein [Ruegeria sp. HKCCD8929]